MESHSEDYKDYNCRSYKVDNLSEPVKYLGNAHFPSAFPQRDAGCGGVGKDVSTNGLLRVCLEAGRQSGRTEV